MVSEPAAESMTQPSATSTPPSITTMRGPKAIDKPGLYRHQPGFSEHEQSESHLDGGAAPMILLVYWVDEQIPAILQIGNHHHANKADE
jgi:hypothetical protein